MENKPQIQEVNPAIIQSLILEGDISKMSQQQKVEYTTKLCERLGLNVLTNPFQIIKFQGKEKLYATKDATEQMRKLHEVSVVESTTEKLEDLIIVRVKVQDKTGRTDVGTGAVVTKNLQPDALANAYMKAETKAKRRATLSICGMGFLDESEFDTMSMEYNNEVLEQKENYIRELLRTSSLPEEKINQVEYRLSNGLNFQELDACIEYLRNNQVDNISAGRNFNQTDIINKIKSEL
ncbi:MAG: hypothetical protein WCJ33_09300 [Pseudomonadota bacterium]